MKTVTDIPSNKRNSAPDRFIFERVEIDTENISTIDDYLNSDPHPDYRLVQILKEWEDAGCVHYYVELLWEKRINQNQD